ncbi:tRNA 4-thiouridine(8) synthase ThiI [Candidatus Pacearchaeota archaeon]|nr:tRNA 4-thiouridine(8) synthase ThiI [Candidatus Pacearchaeota archaeon]
MKPNTIIIHYSEIATKGLNRRFFEDTLIKNIAAALGIKKSIVKRKYGKIVVETEGNEDIRYRLQKIPGIAYFAFGVKAKLDIEDIVKESLNYIGGTAFRTFRVSAKRSNKNFGHTSDEINNIVGKAVLEKFPDSKVKLNAPDIELFIEISEKEAYLYTNNEKFRGIGGLPVGSSGRVIASLSGGIDSPVASFMAMKRGCKVVFVHIHNSSVQGEIVKDKIKKLVDILRYYQNEAKLYIIPFEKLQMDIIMRVPAKIRMIIYRRFMMKIMNRIALNEKAKAVVTGDNIGQVASQTLENINCIHKASLLPVLPPLIGMNKEEIIEIARKIGTYETSIIKGEDCCSFMIAENPETQGKLENIEEAEKKITDAEELVDESVKGAEIVRL